MWINTWFRGHPSQPKASRASTPWKARPKRVRPRLEQLEDRSLPSNFTAATVSDLITDINAANKAGGANTITLIAPTTSPYVLTRADNCTDGPTGLPVISGGKSNATADNLTIIGNGDTIERSTGSGTSAFRLFDLASGASLTLENLTLQNGLAFGSGSAAEGGAVYNQGTLVLSGTTVQNNEAEGSNGADAKSANQDGGAGQDAAGGGIWSSVSLTMENGTLVQNNKALGGNGGSILPSSLNSVGGNGGNAYGGGVDIAGGTANIAGGTLSGNGAQGGMGGAGVPGFGGSGSVRYGLSGFGYGGGLSVTSGTVTVTGASVNNNYVVGGGVKDLDAPFGGAGGGIYIDGAVVTLSNDAVQSNSTGAQGGGGGIFIEGGTVTFCNDTVEYNSADQGGGIYINAGATVYIDDSTLDKKDPTMVINNTGTFTNTANIYGSYIPKNC